MLELMLAAALAAAPTGVAARDARLVAFVQRTSNGEVLQAISLPLACS